jgi:hypothetical protein
MNRIWALAAPAFTLALAATAPAQETPAPPPESPYVGAAGCKDCHAKYYDAWGETKHARSIAHLSAEDLQGGQCTPCHATGTPQQIAAEGASPTLPGIQCEACHGPGRAHADAARAGAPKPGNIVKTPPEKACTRCHNQTSPHFRPFFYAALAPLVHKVR